MGDSATRKAEACHCVSVESLNCCFSVVSFSFLTSGHRVIVVAISIAVFDIALSFSLRPSLLLSWSSWLSSSSSSSSHQQHNEQDCHNYDGCLRNRQELDLSYFAVSLLSYCYCYNNRHRLHHRYRRRRRHNHHHHHHHHNHHHRRRYRRQYYLRCPLKVSIEKTSSAMLETMHQERLKHVIVCL